MLTAHVALLALALTLLARVGPHTPLGGAPAGASHAGREALGTAGAARATTRGAAADDTAGARLYARLCARCHGASGAGDGADARALPVRPAVHASSAAMGRRTDDRLYDAIAGGGGPLGRSPAMPAFGQSLTPAQIRALVRHIRSLCRCAQPAWAADGAPR